MRKYITFILLFVCCSVWAQNNDPHLKRLIECINNSNFVCAAEELPLVENWKYDENYQIKVAENYLSFVRHLSTTNSSTMGLENCKIYYAVELNTLSKSCYDKKEYSKALFYAQLCKELELIESNSLSYSSLEMWIKILEIQLLQ